MSSTRTVPPKAKSSTTSRQTQERIDRHSRRNAFRAVALAGAVVGEIDELEQEGEDNRRDDDILVGGSSSGSPGHGGCDGPVPVAVLQGMGR